MSEMPSPHNNLLLELASVVDDRILKQIPLQPKLLAVVRSTAMSILLTPL